MTETVYKVQLREARDEIERLQQLCAARQDHLNEGGRLMNELTERLAAIRAATIEECEVIISDVFASTSPRDYMMNGPGGILKRMIDALHALKERQT